ncbi:glutathione S-transferase family protein [Sphingomicrobium sp. XHP0239]|uniref:glutathione S-transferase family protein n=1 Tax=Sphingomicrobium maritimum TaxID=3133972 RepID=UPI0031CCCCB8
MAEHGALQVIGFKRVPAFAQGQVRDHRVRWALREVGWEYAVKLIDGAHLAIPAYRAEHPFGQAPLLREERRVTLFESGGIVLDIAERTGRMLPTDRDQQALAKCWTYAALNSVEPFLLELFFADKMIEDKDIARGYRPHAEKFARDRLEKVSVALGDREWLVGDDFSIADLIASSVSKVSGNTGYVDGFPNLAAWRERCFARPAFRDALAEQLTEYERHGPEDMGFDKDPTET